LILDTARKKNKFDKGVVNSSQNIIAGNVQADFVYVFYFVFDYFQRLQYPGRYLRFIGLFMDTKTIHLRTLRGRG